MTKLWENNSIFPMFWLEEFADLDANYKIKLDRMFGNPMKVIHAIQWAVVRWVSIFQNKVYLVLIGKLIVMDNVCKMLFFSFHLVSRFWFL